MDQTQQAPGVDDTGIATAFERDDDSTVQTRSGSRQRTRRRRQRGLLSEGVAETLAIDSDTSTTANEEELKRSKSNRAIEGAAPTQPEHAKRRLTKSDLESSTTVEAVRERSRGPLLIASSVNSDGLEDYNTAGSSLVQQHGQENAIASVSTGTTRRRRARRHDRDSSVQDDVVKPTGTESQHLTSLRDNGDNGGDDDVSREASSASNGDSLSAKPANVMDQLFALVVEDMVKQRVSQAMALDTHKEFGLRVFAPSSESSSNVMCLHRQQQRSSAKTHRSIMTFSTAFPVHRCHLMTSDIRSGSAPLVIHVTTRPVARARSGATLQGVGEVRTPAWSHQIGELTRSTSFFSDSVETTESAALAFCLPQALLASHNGTAQQRHGQDAKGTRTRRTRRPPEHPARRTGLAKSTHLRLQLFAPSVLSLGDQWWSSDEAALSRHCIPATLNVALVGPFPSMSHLHERFRSMTIIEQNQSMKTSRPRLESGQGDDEQADEPRRSADDAAAETVDQTLLRDRRQPENVDSVVDLRGPARPAQLQPFLRRRRLCRTDLAAKAELITGQNGPDRLAFSSSGRLIAMALQSQQQAASGSVSGATRTLAVVRTDQLVSSRHAPVITFSGHRGAIYDLAWSSDDSFLMTASADGTAAIWALVNPSFAPRVILPHPAFVYAAQFYGEPEATVVDDAAEVLSSHRRRHVATAAFDGIIRLWSIEADSGEHLLESEVAAHAEAVSALVTDDAQTRLYSGCRGGIVKAWALAKDAGSGSSLELLRAVEDASTQADAVLRMRLHPSRTRLLVCFQSALLRILDLRSWSYSGSFDPKFQANQSLGETILDTGPVWSSRSTFSACGTFVFTPLDDSMLVWNSDTFAALHRITSAKPHPPFRDVSFHPTCHVAVAANAVGAHLFAADSSSAEQRAHLSSTSLLGQSMSTSSDRSVKLNGRRAQKTRTALFEAGYGSGRADTRPLLPAPSLEDDQQDSFFGDASLLDSVRARLAQAVQPTPAEVDVSERPAPDVNGVASGIHHTSDGFEATAQPTYTERKRRREARRRNVSSTSFAGNEIVMSSTQLSDSSSTASSPMPSVNRSARARRRHRQSTAASREQDIAGVRDESIADNGSALCGLEARTVEDKQLSGRKTIAGPNTPDVSLPGQDTSLVASSQPLADTTADTRMDDAPRSRRRRKSRFAQDAW